MLKEETPPMQQCNTQREGQDVSKIINIVTIKNVVIGETTALPENYYDSLNSEELGTIGAISDFTQNHFSQNYRMSLQYQRSIINYLQQSRKKLIDIAGDIYKSLAFVRLKLSWIITT